MHGLNTHPIERLLHRLAEAIWRHPRWFVYPQLALFAAAIAYSALFLAFKTDINDLVSSDTVYQQQWQALKDEFQLKENLVALVESGDREKNRQFVERLAARIEVETNLFTGIFYKGDLRTMGPKALLMLPEERLEQVLHALRDYQPLVGKFSNVTNLNSLFTEVEAQWRATAKEGGTNSNMFAAAVPALTRIVDQGAESLQRSGVPPSPGVTTLFANPEDQSSEDYLKFARGRFYVVTCTARDVSLQTEAILRLRELVEATRMEVPGVNAGVTGEPVLNHDEMKQAQIDTSRASVVALVVVALTFISCYHQIRRPLMATVCLLIGIGYTLGFATLTVGYLNILTITFVPILIGMAIDFGVHLIARYEEELREGRTERVALVKALVATGTGILTSGLTTAAAFMAMMLTGFKGIREMGLISGGGLLVCLVPMMTMLPAMLVMRRDSAPKMAPSARRAWHCERERLEQMWLDRPRVVIWVGAVLTALAGATIGWLKFDYNPLHLQSQSLPAVIYEQRLIKAASHSILSCAMTANSLDEALELEKRIRRLRSVADVDSIAPIVAGNQERKLSLVRQITEAAADLDFAPMDRQPVDLATLDKTLADFGRAVVGAVQYMGPAMDERVKTQLYALREAVGRWRGAIATGPRDQNALQATLYQRALFSDLEGTLTALKQQLHDKPLRMEDLPSGIRARFVGRTGKILLQIYPRGDVWEHKAQEVFVRELRTINPAVTGSPVRFYENTTRLKSSFQIAAVYAVVAIAIMLLFHFRNVACVLLALLPVAVGIVWTFGFMVMFGIVFNPANVIAPTLLIGIGVANGIHILNRFIEEKHPSILGKSTGKAVLVSALTTATGFGSLMLAQHAGIASLGEIMALGTALCLLASVTVLPAVLILLVKGGFRLGHGWLTR